MSQNTNVGNLFLEAAKAKLEAKIKNAESSKSNLYVCRPCWCWRTSR